MINRCNFWRVTLAFAFVCAVAVAHATTPILTKEQVQKFRQLPAAEREALLRTLRTGRPAAGLRTTSGQEAETRADEMVSPAAIGTESFKAPRLKPGDTIIIHFTPHDEAEEKDRLRAEKLGPPIELPDQKLFVLDQFGAITLKKAGRIVLKGLNEEEAAARIGAEPPFQELRVEVRLLPIEEPLKPFGYDLFTGAAKTLMPAMDVPVPADYVVGPGDALLIQLFGKENVEHELVITRDGTVLFPGIGPIPVAGLTFSQLQNEIHNRVRKQLIGVKASVTLGRLRSIRVFVLGDVERPGSYTVSGLSTITNALFVSGGVKRIGSLRNVQLKRRGKLITRFDLYDLLLRGDSRRDRRLQAGDVIFIPSIGKTAGIAGRVRRPAIYELKKEKTIDDLIAMAGGLAPDAYPQGAQIERILASHERTLIDVDLTQKETRKTELRDGDVIKIYSILEKLKSVVTLSGQVHRPGEYQWKPNMRLTDLISSLANLLPEVDARYLLIKRENSLDRSIELLGADLVTALENPDSQANVFLQPRDEVHVFDIHGDRAAVIEPLLEQARARSAPDRPEREVSLAGMVHHPGRYPLSPNMRIGDLLLAAGGLTDRAYTLEAELSRFTVIDGKEREQSRQTIDLAALLQGDSEKDIALESYDRLVIRRIPKWDEDGTIEIVGEVRFPGKYPIRRGEKLSDVIKRAGGPTDEAFPKGAIFIRESVRQREQEHLERLFREMERELAILSVKGPEIGVKKEAALVEGQALLRQLRVAKAAGRMVIKLEDVLEGREGYGITVQGGDKLFIPQRPREVTVIGEVYYPTSHLSDAELSSSDYIRLSGGVKEKGNKKAIYVVHAGGSVSSPRRWFGGSVEVGPGDTIVVPLKVDRVSKLKLFKDVSTILFQLAVTAAALDTINAL